MVRCCLLFKRRRLLIGLNFVAAAAGGDVISRPADGGVFSFLVLAVYATPLKAGLAEEAQGGLRSPSSREDPPALHRVCPSCEMMLARAQVLKSTSFPPFFLFRLLHRS